MRILLDCEELVFLWALTRLNYEGMFIREFKSATWVYSDERLSCTTLFAHGDLSVGETLPEQSKLRIKNDENASAISLLIMSLCELCQVSFCTLNFVSVSAMKEVFYTGAVVVNDLRRVRLRWNSSSGPRLNSFHLKSVLPTTDNYFVKEQLDILLPRKKNSGWQNSIKMEVFVMMEFCSYWFCSLNNYVQCHDFM